MGTVLSDTMLRTSLLSLTAVIAVCSGANQNAYGRLWDDLFDDKAYNPEIIPVEHIPQSIRVPGNKIWKPDFSFYNQIEYREDGADNQLKNSQYNAVILSTGLVIWIPPVSFEVDCSWLNEDEFHIPLMKSPEDPVDCQIKIGSWTYDGHHLNITTFNLMGKDDGGKMELNDFSANSPYLVVAQEGENAIQSKFYDCCPNEPYMTIVFKFKVQKAYTLASDEEDND